MSTEHCVSVTAPLKKRVSPLYLVVSDFPSTLFLLLIKTVGAAAGQSGFWEEWRRTIRGGISEFNTGEEKGA